MSTLPSAPVASTTRCARPERLGVGLERDQEIDRREPVGLRLGQHQGQDLHLVRPGVERDLVAAPRRARAGHVAGGRLDARRRQVGAEAVDERERVDVDARLGGRAAQRCAGPRLVGVRPVPDAIPDGHRLHVDVERRALQVRLGLRVLGPDVDGERGAVERDRRLGPFHQRARDRARHRAVEVHGGRIERGLQRAGDHLLGIGHLGRRHRRGQRPDPEHPPRADDDEHGHADHGKAAPDSSLWTCDSVPHHGPDWPSSIAVGLQARACWPIRSNAAAVRDVATTGHVERHHRANPRSTGSRPCVSGHAP